MCRVMTDAFRYVGAFLFTLLLIHFYSFLVLFYISYSILFYSILASSFSFTHNLPLCFLSSPLLSFPPCHPLSLLSFILSCSNALYPFILDISSFPPCPSSSLLCAPLLHSPSLPSLFFSFVFLAWE